VHHVGLYKGVILRIGGLYPILLIIQKDLRI